MSDLPAISGKDALKAFEKAGFALVRIASSHHILKKPGHTYLLSIPIHGNKSLKPGTLRGLIRGAGLTVSSFIELIE